MGNITEEELLWLRSQMKQMQEGGDTKRVNPFDTGEGNERTANRLGRRLYRQIGGADLLEAAQLMQEYQARMIPLLKDEGQLGGRGESSRNPGSRTNTGIDWLKEKYNPANNPFEGRDAAGEARGAVANRRAEQQQQRHNDAINIGLNGELTRNVGGASITDLFGANRGDQGAQYALGQGVSPDMSILNVPEQYGGGLGYGSSIPLPKANPAMMLPTGGYNPQLGVGGSGVPMSAGEAAATDSLGNGIYGPRDASNPASQDANMARRILAQAGIKQRIGESRANPFKGSTAQAQPAVQQVLPLLPAAPAPSQPMAAMPPQGLNPNQYMDFSWLGDAWKWLFDPYAELGL